MAIISTLIGGISGFISFMIAMVFFNVGLLQALALYAVVGFGLTALLITAALSWRLLIVLSLPVAPKRAYSDPARGSLAKRGG